MADFTKIRSIQISKMFGGSVRGQNQSTGKATLNIHVDGNMEVLPNYKKVFLISSYIAIS